MARVLVSSTLEADANREAIHPSEIVSVFDLVYLRLVGRWSRLNKQDLSIGVVIVRSNLAKFEKLG